MKLYFMPGACSLAPHIVFREAGLDVAIEKVDTKEQRTASGADFRGINPKGQVPTLQLDNGQVLTEVAVIVQYLADLKPEAKLLPAQGSMERYRTQEWLNFISSELHKGFSPLFNSKMPAEARQLAQDALFTKFDFVNKHLQGKDYLMGSGFTVADAYLFTVLGWARFLKMDLSKWANLVAFSKRIAERPAVHAAMKAEGLL